MRWSEMLVDLAVSMVLAAIFVVEVLFAYSLFCD